MLIYCFITSCTDILSLYSYITHITIKTTLKARFCPQTTISMRVYHPHPKQQKSPLNQAYNPIIYPNNEYLLYNAIFALLYLTLLLWFLSFFLVMAYLVLLGIVAVCNKVSYAQCEQSILYLSYVSICLGLYLLSVPFLFYPLYLYYLYLSFVLCLYAIHIP